MGKQRRKDFFLIQIKKMVCTIVILPTDLCIFDSIELVNKMGLFVAGDDVRIAKFLQNAPHWMLYI